MRRQNQSISRFRETFYTTLISSLTFACIGAIVKTISHVPQSGLMYSTNEVPTYPMPYRNHKFAPAEIQGKLLVEGTIKALSVMVRNEGEHGSDALVRIPCSADDKCLGGWMSKSDDPSFVYMLGEGAEYRFHKLLPGDTVRFYLYLKDVNSDLARRIEVFDADGRRAAYYRYVPVRYDAIIVSIRTQWIYLFASISVPILLLSLWRIRRPGRSDISAAGRSLADACERPSTASPCLTGSDESKSVSEALDGGGRTRSSCPSGGRQERELGGRG